MVVINYFKQLLNCYQTGGGGERDRTDDLLLAKQALSQLSYTPLIKKQQKTCHFGGPG